MKKASVFSSLKLKNDEELKQHVLKVIEETAKENGKSIYSVSLEDIYQAVTEIRNSKPAYFFRNIKLSQFITLKETTGKISQAVTVASSFKNPLYLIYIPVKKYISPYIKRKTKNLGWHFGIKWLSNKIFKQKKTVSKSIK